MSQKKTRFFSSNFTETGCPDWAILKKRINKKPRKKSRQPSGLPNLDDLLGGGLPAGLITLYGKSGSGKSRLAKAISKGMLEQGFTGLHFFGEDSIDTLDPSIDNLNTIDMVQWKMGPQKATKCILKCCQELQPDFLILDSLTTIFGATSKAVMEADVREYTAILSHHIEGKLPTIAISETRGQGYSFRPAGGRGVLFPAIINILLDSKVVTNKWDSAKYQIPQGRRVWTLLVEKDRDGLATKAMQQEHIIQYVGQDPQFDTLKQYNEDDNL